MVQPNAYQSNQQAPQQAPRDPWDQIEGGGGAPAIKFSKKDNFGRTLPAEVGLSYTGLLTENLKSAFITDFETGEIERWPNGDPKEQIIATIQTDLQEHEEDDGIRRIFFKGQMKSALQQEFKEKRLGRVGPGTRFTVTLVDLKPPKNPTFNPQNIYRVDVGPEIEPFVDEQQARVDAALQGQPTAAGTRAAVQQGFPPAQPQQQYVAPASQQQGIATQAQLDAFQQAAAQAQPQLPLVTPEDVTAVNTLRRAGLPPEVAAANYAAAQVPPKGADFVAALQAAAVAAVPVQ